MTHTYYIGFDVHKDSIAITHALKGSRDEPTYHGECGGSNPAIEKTLRKLAKSFGQKIQDLKASLPLGS